MSASEAADVFGLQLEGMTHDSVNAAYREAAKTCHPDSGAYDPEKWARITWAKDVLMKVLPASTMAELIPEGACRACGGKGYIQRRTGFSIGPRMRCVLCQQ